MPHPRLHGRALLPGLLLFAALSLALVAPRASILRARAISTLTPSGEITRISIPTIGVDSKVIEVRRGMGGRGRGWIVADSAAGHHEGSGVPGGGTNIVLAGHNNINGEVFRRLDELRRGDLVTLRTDDGATHPYKVTRVRIVREEGASGEQRRANARYMRPTKRERLTLISCWPYRPWPPYRVIVLADPAKPPRAP